MPTPLERALTIRQQLKGSVELISAEQWGARRQYPADPQRALDCYVANRCIFSIQDGPNTFYPWFQFDPSTAYPRLEITTVLTMIPPTIDGWSLLSWFEAPNRLLDGEKPSLAIVTMPERCFEAARSFYCQE